MWWRGTVTITVLKAVVIAFSDLAATIRFLSTLSAVTAKELAERYLQKSLAGRKSGGQVAVVVSEQKQFSFTFSIKRGHIDIFFYFGEWNSYGFPQHKLTCNAPMSIAEPSSKAIPMYLQPDCRVWQVAAFDKISGADKTQILLQKISGALLTYSAVWIYYNIF